MSDTILALGITVLLLTALAAWVPLLHAAERLTRRNARYVAENLPQSSEQKPTRPFEREAA